MSTQNPIEVTANLGDPGYGGNKLLFQVHARNNTDISISRHPFPYSPYSI